MLQAHRQAVGRPFHGTGRAGGAGQLCTRYPRPFTIRAEAGKRPSRRWCWRVRSAITRPKTRLLWNLMLASKFAGTPGEAVAYGEASLAIAREHKLRQRMAYTLNDLASSAMSMPAEPERCACQPAGGPPTCGVELGNQPMQADNLSSTAFIYFMTGDFDQRWSLRTKRWSSASRSAACGASHTVTGR